MAKKKNKRVSFNFLKLLLITLAGAGIIVFVGIRIVDFAVHSPTFRIKKIVLDTSLDIVDPDDLVYLKGKNIFEADLMAVQKRLNALYPQLEQLKVLRQYPDQIFITARKRTPFAQVKAGGRIAVLNEKGIILSVEGYQTKGLPLILGRRNEDRRALPGMLIRAKDVQDPLRIIREIRREPAFAAWTIENVDVGNMSKIVLLFGNGLKILVDRNNVEEKITMLKLVFAQGDFNLDQVNYVDLRFKEPVIGRK